MKVVIQKVKRASVTVDKQIISSIQKGLMLLVGISTEDTAEDVDKLSSKILKLKLFEEQVAGSDDVPASFKAWSKSVVETKGEILSVSQFTLYANIKKGSKPDFHKAQKGHVAVELYNLFLQRLREGMQDESSVKDGKFGAMMDVELVNDGPVTIVWDTREK
ncbi:hypothetical protein PACTADRAFT_73913 [Pachysolen tannophilus NRRL Y-2460]|uniref:D-aminoacyl-tRNA deacylase n=1 Tax=Pachysolen tannophilus NRRL Y-2460 TaxID=669874 RepID=A0A1E4U2W3_PACTA|nr:hypothetical protein PACTADRAFT_73913 [Pachysolen tannophilus NRRL Y-2460]